MIVNRDSALTWNRHYYRIKGNRHYELTNHLGNVLAVITDRKIAKDTTADATYTPQFFMPDVYSVQNYYAFGQTMPKWSTSAPVNDPTRYRFGFNGKEDDDEWGKQDYGMRIYDARVARFLSVDPIATEYPWYTPYQFAGNMPICAIDLDGMEEYYAADGEYLGNAGGFTEIRIISRKDVVPIAKKSLSYPKGRHEWLLDHSKIAYKYDEPREIDLLNDWSVINLKKIEDREPTMSLFTKDLVKKGKSFKAVIEGSTEWGPGQTHQN